MHDGSLGLFKFDPIEPAAALAPPPEAEAESADRSPAHYHGHRDRLRLRARRAGPAALPDYELLELFLYRSIPRADVKPLAKALLARFGGLAGVLGAAIADLRQVPGVGEAVALDLKLMQEAALRMGRETLRKRPLISSWSALLAYVRAELAQEAKEQFRVLFLDKKIEPSRRPCPRRRQGLAAQGKPQFFPHTTRKRFRLAAIPIVPDPTRFNPPRVDQA